MVGLQTCVYVYSNRNDLMPVLKHTSLTRMAISINLISRSSCIHRLHFEILHNYCTASDKHAVVSLLFSLLFFCSADAQSSALLQHSISSAIKQVIYTVCEHWFYPWSALLCCVKQFMSSGIMQATSRWKSRSSEGNAEKHCSRRKEC